MAEVDVEPSEHVGAPALVERLDRPKGQAYLDAISYLIEEPA
jgi:hypothetical protein